MSKRVVKDSGIEWIGEIPKNWEVKKIKHLATEKNTVFLDGDWIESEFITNSGIRLIQTGNVGIGFYKEQGFRYITEETFKELNCRYIETGDLLISRLAGPVGRSCLAPKSKEKMICSVDVCSLRPNGNIDSKFLNFCFATKGHLEHCSLIARGATLQRISRKQLGNVSVAIPPLHEQQAIATYLDEQVSRLDQLIEDQQQVIEDWKAYKQSLITETVTKGLNLEVALKDSGIEWIGEIPSHWEVVKVKNNFQLLTGSTPKSDELSNWGNDLIWVTPVDFKAKSLFSSTRKLSWKGYNSCGTTLVPKNSILITCRAPIGAVALAGTELCFNQGCKGLVAKDDDVLENYFYYYFVSNNQSLNLFGRGTTFLELSSTALNNFPIPVPPLHEQQQIAEFLDEKCSKIDQLIEDKQRLIEDLKDYKQSLIYECVTGKKSLI